MGQTPSEGLRSCGEGVNNSVSLDGRQSLWCHTGGTCWKSIFWNMLEIISLGFYRKLSVVTSHWRHGASATKLPSGEAAGHCWPPHLQDLGASEHARGRKQKDSCGFFHCLCPLLPSYQLARQQYLSGPEPFPQRSPKG